MQSQKGKQKITTALFNYIPEAEGELALVRGKLVTLISCDGNYWKGESQGEVGYFPRSFVRNPDEGSLVIASPKKSLGSSGFQEQIEDLQRQLRTSEAKVASLQARGQDGSNSDSGRFDEIIADLKKQLERESQQVAELRRSKAALEAIIATSGKSSGSGNVHVVVEDKKSGGGGAESTLIEDLRAQLEKKKQEISELNGKKNKYKKHAMAADSRNKELKKKLEQVETQGIQGEVEELRAAKASLEQKLKAVKQDYDELEKEVQVLEQENSELEEELKKRK